MANDNKLVNLADLKAAFDDVKKIASQSSAGLMSADDKKKLDGVASGATANTGTVTSVATGAGLTGGTITGSGTVKANLTSENKLSNAAADGTETSGRVYPVRLDKNGKLAVNVPWVDTNTDTNTHYSTSLVVGASNGSANAATTNGNTYLMVKDDNTVRTRLNIKGTGATTVTSNASGVITINSTAGSVIKANTLSGTTNGNGFLVTSISQNTTVISARCDTPATGCLTLVYSGVWYFMPIVPSNGQVTVYPNQSVTIIYYYI